MRSGASAQGRRTQRGVALITALLVAALGTVLAVAMAQRQRIEIRRTENLLQWDQAAAFADAVVEWGGLILQRDGEAGATDSLDEPWATLLPPIVIEEGALWGGIEDLQGRINLNNLVGTGALADATRSRFLRLLDHLDLDQTLMDAIIDWMDADADVSGVGGAEDDYYTRLTPPYRAANRPFTEVSELRLIRGLSAQAYARLTPHITALPGGTAININTAGATVLASLSDALDPFSAEVFVEIQEQGGFSSVGQFATQAVFDAFPLDTAGLDVASHHFLITAEVSINQFKLREQRHLARDVAGGAVQTVARRYGSFD